MATILRATCPKCRTALRIPAEWVGRTIRCKTCGALVRSRPKSDPRTAEASPLDPTMHAPNGIPVSSDPLGDFDAPPPQPIPVYPLPQPVGSPLPPPSSPSRTPRH